MSHFTRAVLATMALILMTATAFAADRINTLDRKGLFGYKESGIALRGFDTVAYFTEGKPLEGKDEFTTEWMNATWKFANQEHLALFEANPEQYAPQYGGYCAYGVAQNALVKIEPDLWEIVDDKLYLNYDDGVQKKWEKDIAGFIAEADAKFEGLLNE
ncbi:MAG: hypothetical protein KTR33_16405 [Gammaproteobacteria bacterium]|nr:hypothetical protein [Gammaproteobacteria bacterium]